MCDININDIAVRYDQSAHVVCRYACRYVGVSVWMYGCMYVCMYVGMSVCMYVCMYICRYVCVSVCMCVCRYKYLSICRYVGMYVDMSICMYVCHRHSMASDIDGHSLPRRHVSEVFRVGSKLGSVFIDTGSESFNKMTKAYHK